MLETIFEWLTHAVGEGLEAIINVVFQCLSLDLTVFVTNFPGFALAYDILRYAGLGLVMMFAIVSLLKFKFGDLEDVRESPANVLIRSFAAIGMIFAGGHVLVWTVNVAKLPYDAVLSVDAVRITGGSETMDLSWLLGHTAVDAILGIGSYGIIPAALLLIRLVMILIIGIELAKLLIEVFERFMMVGVLVYSAPLAFSTFATKETSAIFGKWVSMFVSQCLLMTLSVWILKMAASGFSASVGDYTPYIVRFFLTLALCKIAQRIDSYVQRLGLNSVTTGGGLLDSAVGTILAFGAFRRRGSASSVLGQVGGNGATGSGIMGMVSGAARGVWNASPLGSVFTGVKDAAKTYSGGGTKEEARAAYKRATANRAGPIDAAKAGAGEAHRAAVAERAAEAAAAVQQRRGGETSSAVQAAGAATRAAAALAGQGSTAEIARTKDGKRFRLAGDRADLDGMKIDGRTGTVSGPQTKVASLLQNQMTGYSSLSAEAKQAVRNTIAANPDAAAAAMEDRHGPAMSELGSAGADALRHVSPDLEALTDADGKGFENVARFSVPASDVEGNTMPAYTEIHADGHGRDGRAMHVTWTDSAGYARKTDTEKRGWKPDGNGGFYLTETLGPGEYGAVSEQQFRILQNSPNARLANMSEVKTRDGKKMYVNRGRNKT